MYDIPNQLYLEVADRLIARFGTSDYFSGTLSLDYEGVMCSLLLSAIIYRRCERCDEGERLLIADVVPVWWEFHTVGEQGEVLNDFSFNVLRQYLRQTL